MTSFLVFDPDCGMNRVSRPLKLSAVKPASRFMAAYAAAARPTTSVGYKRATRIQ